MNRQRERVPFINRPTIPIAQYKAAKRAAPGGDHRPRSGPRSAPTPQAITSIAGFDGDAQGGPGGSLFPPDNNGPVSRTQNAQVNNSDFTVFAKSTAPGPPLLNVSLNALAGYSAQTLFDPRILYDPQWNRWVIEAEAFRENSTTQIQVIMISKTSDATAGFLVYKVNVGSFCGTGGFWDYPQIGMTQDAVLLTANCFGADNSYGGAKMFAVAKAKLYNALGFSVPVFSQANTTTPPIVVDENPRAHMLIAGNTVSQTSWSYPANGFYSYMGSPAVISGWFTPSIPRSAGQSGCSATSCNIDTGDGRFEAPSVQYGDSLWNVATYGLSGAGTFATPSWGQFDVEGAGTNTLKQQGRQYAGGCSDDYHASIVASTAGAAWLNWATSDPEGSTCSGGTFVGGRIATRVATDPLGTLPSIATSDTSGATLTGNFDSNFGVQRFGDTSSISLDPLNPLVAWSWQERVNSSSAWGTHSARIGQ